MPGQTDRAGQEIANQWQPFLGQLSQIANPLLPARTNLVDLGYMGLTDGALAATGVAAAAPVRVVPGDKFTKIGILVGATAAVTPTHQAAALYAGTGAEPALLKKSADATTTAIAEKLFYQWTLEETLEISEAMCPHGFVYPSASITAGTIPTAAVGATPAGINYRWMSGGPLFLAMTHGSALAGVMPGKIESAAAKAVAPIFILT